MDPETGVRVRPSNFYFQNLIRDDPFTLAKMEELSGKVDGFRHDAALIAENEVNSALGLRDAYVHLAPMADTDHYMRWLLGQCRAEGCKFVGRELTGSLAAREAELVREFEADAIVNCTGLGAAALTGDKVLPLRGALVRIRNDGRSAPKITQAHCVSRTDGNGFIFVLPRGDDLVVLGGLAELGETEIGIGMDTYEPVREMYRNCIAFLPALRTAEIDAAEPVRVGLRPLRMGNVRLEHEPETRIVHNYGHGGSGVTLSWGCALEVVDLVEAMVEAVR